LRISRRRGSVIVHVATGRFVGSVIVWRHLN